MGHRRAAGVGDEPRDPRWGDASEERTAAWRGVVLRHQSVGAWRRLWAALVDQVCGAGVASRDLLHE